ncbi:MAG: TIGR04084 family radical SAM/SPASM domain-containing protein [Candidatus Hodarchaeales archaeon]
MDGCLVNYFVFLTQVCNLRCKYCGGTLENLTTPLEISYSLEDLKKFLENDPDGDPIICFYGGEPCLRVELMERIINEIPAKKFIIQTNGTKLDLVPRNCLEKIDTILLSIDGRLEITDSYRGEGIHAKVLKNAIVIRNKGFNGDLIARMTVTESSKIDEEVTYLLEEQVKFNHVHWQLDAFWTSDNQWTDFNRWVRKVYNPGISRLATFWMEQIEKTGNVPGIVPFQGVMKNLLSGRDVSLYCGAGIDFFAINTSGLITACPICPDWEEFHMGNIFDNKPVELRNSMLIGYPCPECEIYGICGGRCLFANKTKLWDQEDFDLVCLTVKHLVNEMKRHKKRIQMLIDNGWLQKDDFRYPFYNNSCEIIP